MVKRIVHNLTLPLIVASFIQISACTAANPHPREIAIGEEKISVTLKIDETFKPQIFYPFGTSAFETVKKPQWIPLEESPNILLKPFVGLFRRETGILLQTAPSQSQSIMIQPVNLLVADSMAAFAEFRIYYKFSSGETTEDRFSVACNQEFPTAAYPRALMEAASNRAAAYYYHRSKVEPQGKLPAYYKAKSGFLESPVTYVLNLFKNNPEITVVYFETADSALSYLPKEFETTGCLMYTNNIGGGVRCVTPQKIKIPAKWSSKLTQTPIEPN
ncbi:hypothetical protein LEP1GSC047_3744 [Leptospira inadai serovar Lyme str. 10]|uniref:Lipoprotein n=2 Tax=Leptospira inadai serovar Lyme TaxID=293084 RepID=V6HCV7_9LEPT|nr:hypothetical protein [Leptospira inadai]EQA37811.1 hypothetical protein LEP1GSC047_3744 [Leptospira inadai serovar Lyme str. 10]PNV75079.1 hypothetical protein BES34_011010 [Leptospira inadai serovar Lyme]